LAVGELTFCKTQITPIIEQNSYMPTNIEQEPHTNQSHQQMSYMQDLKKHNEKPV
jgi:hypothetical protein